ncbi:hypothetical protein CLU79DRAFT_750609 [Phycomyces nitens]|nr:hypothetical protein CLU79DRAFT_750609 [Phycomyces nitens]
MNTIYLLSVLLDILTGIFKQTPESISYQRSKLTPHTHNNNNNYYSYSVQAGSKKTRLLNTLQVFQPDYSQNNPK